MEQIILAANSDATILQML